MDINPRLYVEIHPLTAGQLPHPHPVTEAHFDPAYVYKVLGMYNPSETSECYMILSNTQRQIWFIPQRHLLAYKLLDSDEFFLPMDRCCNNTQTEVKAAVQTSWDRTNEPLGSNGHSLNHRLEQRLIP